MSPQQVPILAFDAINLAKTMRASFKTAEVAGYFGWGWLPIGSFLDLDNDDEIIIESQKLLEPLERGCWRCGAIRTQDIPDLAMRRTPRCCLRGSKLTKTKWGASRPFFLLS
jgi:hypothetical protein